MRLTLPQQDVYFEQLLYPNEPIYNIGAKIAIKGDIDFETLNEAYIKLIDQHDAYRSIVVRTEGNAEMKILSEHKSTLGYVDFSNQEDANNRAEVFMQTAFQEPFDFNSKELLHKFILVKVDKINHYLFSVYHHIITDGWGTSLMFQRLVTNYNELMESGRIETEYPYSYQDFVSNDEVYSESEDFLKDRLFWKNKFQNLPERLFEKLDDTIDINKSSRKELIIKRSIYNQLLDIAKENKCSTFQVILALLYLYFGKKHQNRDFAIGLPVLNRSKSVFKKTVGLFMGVSALRIPLDFEDTFEDLISQIKQQLRQDYRHQRYPLGKLIKELDVFQDKERLFNITLSYEKQDYSDHFTNTETRVIPLTHQSERVALAVYIREFDELEDVKIDFDYNVNYFDKNSASQLVAHFECLMKDVVRNTKKKLLDYNYLTEKEEQQLLRGFNQTRSSYNKETTLLSSFDDQVKKKPNSISIQDRFNTYTYKELDIRSNQVANYISREFGKEDKAPITVLMNRSADLVTVLLGVFKSGRAYIPLDPSFPKERLKYIIGHSDVKCIIGGAEQQDIIDTEVRYINIETLLNDKSINKTSFLSGVQSSDTAYIIYTSGSTGDPKGVEVGHQSLLNFLLSMQQKPGVTQEDILFSVTTQSFDISILEFFTPLISGARLYVIDNDTLIDPLAIIEELKQVNPTIIQATPSFYQMLYNANWGGDNMLKVLCGGDLLSESLAESLINTCSEVWNMYGPTETTIWSSIKKVEKPQDASNIGRPIHNTDIYVLDEYKKLLPVGTTGAIYIGGDGLAKGYFKNEVLTKEKFVKNPFNENEKVYDTGDIGRWNTDGGIEFLGRNDNQVKIRGYRIELGDIETKLNQLDTIKSSVVVAQKKTNQEASLIGYVIPNQKLINVDEVINQLQKELPEYMIPYTIIPLENFPLTPNKKVNRKVLALKDIEVSSVASQYKRPISFLEIKLCKYYKEVLETKNEIGTTDNFFRLGGHSLNAVRLIGKIEKELGYQISLKTIFDYPTIASLSSFLERKEIQELKSIPKTTIKSHYPITLPQYAIWLASFQSEKSVAYNMFRSYRVNGEFDHVLLEKALRKIIGKYEMLRTNFVEFKGTPHQIIRSNKETCFKIDRFFVDNSNIKRELEEYANQEFDLKEETLVRLGMFETSTGDRLLLFVTHHIMMDGWSLEVLIKEVIGHYISLTSGINFQQEKLNLQFKDYAVWQHNIELNNRNDNYQFWKQYLNNYRWRSLVSYDQDEKLSEKYSGSFYHFDWDKAFLEKLNQTALSQKTTLHTLLATVFNILVYKMQGLKDICIGTINSGRPFSDLHSQIGMFVKTLPLRLKVDPDQLFTDMLQNVQKDMLAIDKHQDIPEEILSSLRLEAILVLQNPTFNYEKIEINQDFSLEFNPVDAKYNRLPLLVSFSINEEHLHGSIYYDTSKYEIETIELLVLKYKKILEELVRNPNISINDINADLAFEQEQAINIDFSF
ncbi:amino acid adenylation domain-containing protein [Aquimarina sp. MMG015]|uniref:non-ribosomal peptide synthetase n=1 Tax=Aquimarina sp. MMG015 TaxID=2822689 RepID=UPI001B3A3F1C|nr:non-ribosomal peptide synthetase [Aquimarina sp. MMG015]MBQ4803356.1 amino acid adenylation domain-containing protein [Aquimarina sp. MMG015]